MKRPEEINWRIVETDFVNKKATDVFMKENKDKSNRGLLLKEIYKRLKEDLKNYPPNNKRFSEPKLDLSTGLLTYWVWSENSQILLRAHYFVPAENCVIDRFYLAEEKPKDLDLN